MDAGTWPAIWLRDNCPCPDCRVPGSGQKLFQITDLPEDLVVAAVEQDPTTVTVTFGPDGHRSVFGRDWLAATGRADFRTEDGKRLWSGPGAPVPTGDWERYRADPGHRAEMLDAVLTDGFALLRGVPVQAGMVAMVAGTFGHVRETNYGRVFDVRVESTPANLASTGLALSPHTGPVRLPRPRHRPAGVPAADRAERGRADPRHPGQKPQPAGAAAASGRGRGVLRGLPAVGAAAGPPGAGPAHAAEPGRLPGLRQHPGAARADRVHQHRRPAAAGLLRRSGRAGQHARSTDGSHPQRPGAGRGGQPGRGDGRYTRWTRSVTCWPAREPRPSWASRSAWRCTCGRPARWPRPRGPRPSRSRRRCCTTSGTSAG